MASEGAVPPAVSNASSVARAPTSSSRPAADMDARAPSDGASPSSATASTAPSQPQPQPHPAPTGRKQSEALGPATESPISPPAATGPALSITLMLITGARHPYKIDEKYLTARDTVARAPDGSFDPRQISGYKLKELIWTDWRGEWEPRPAAPSSIRLINMGQMVDDKKTLNGTLFSLSISLTGFAPQGSLERRDGEGG